jgi:hypothetical protein
MSGWLVKLKKGNLIWSSYLVYNWQSLPD